MSGYTKGPWVSYGSGVATEAFGLKPDRTHGYGCGATFVCCLNDGEYHEYSDLAEQEANARLIAAAPELLEALLLILPLAKGYAPEGQSLNARQTCNSWITAAEDAIAKATGADQ